MCRRDQKEQEEGKAWNPMASKMKSPGHGKIEILQIAELQPSMTGKEGLKLQQPARVVGK